MKNIIIVNSNDEPIGIAEKLKAHQEGLLHRAFSLFIYRINPQNQIEILLQQRHSAKYHSGGLWTNTCCSHPAPGENLEEAIIRRVQEELGISFSLISLQKAGVFHYTANVGNNLIENEIDHVYIIKLSYDQTSPPAFQCNVDPNEISQISWVTIDNLKNNLHNYPEKYTAWLAQALKIMEDFLTQS